MLACFLLLSSCQQSEAPGDSFYSPASSVAKQIIRVQASIPAAVDTAVVTPRAITHLETGMELEANSHVYVVPKLTQSERQATSFKAVVALLNKTKGQLHTSIATWNLEDHNWEGGTGKHFYLENLELDANMKPTNTTDEWYLLAITGTGDYDDSRREFSCGYNSSAYDNGRLILPAVNPGQRLSLAVPFASSWRRLKWDDGHQHFELYDNQRVLKFEPQGAFFIFDLVNYMRLGVDVNRDMTLETNGYASKGLYNFNRIVNQASYRQGITDNKDGIADLWETQDESIPEYLSSPVFSDTDKRHYRIPFRLGSSGKVHLDKSAGSSSPTKLGQHYLVWLQKIDPYRHRAVSSAEGLDEMNVIYAEAEVNEPGRTTFIERTPDYSNGDRAYRNTVNTKTWKPYLGNRYIIATIPQGKERGKSHLVKLRIVRPQIPIEYVGRHVLWSNKQNPGFSESWHIPFDRELLNLLKVPVNYLEERKTAPSGLSASYWVNSIGWVQPRFVGKNDLPLRVAGRSDIRGLTSAFGRDPENPNIIYAVMYKSDQNLGARWSGPTNNYMVAVRMTLNENATHYRDTSNPRRNVLIEHYYLGPNLYLGHKTATLVAYAMTPLFWNRIDPNAIIKRKFPFRPGSNEHYWINKSEDPGNNYETHANYDGEAHVQKSGYVGLNHRFWTVPWLSDKYKAW